MITHGEKKFVLDKVMKFIGPPRMRTSPCVSWDIFVFLPPCCLAPSLCRSSSGGLSRERTSQQRPVVQGLISTTFTLHTHTYIYIHSHTHIQTRKFNSLFSQLARVFIYWRIKKTFLYIFVYLFIPQNVLNFCDRNHLKNPIRDTTLRLENSVLERSWQKHKYFVFRQI